MPFAPAVLCTASAHYTPSSSTSLIFQKGSKQTAHSFRCTSFRSIRSQTVCIYWKARRVAFVKAKQGAMQAQSAAVATGTLRVPSAWCICLFPQAGKSLYGLSLCTPPVPLVLQNWSVKKSASSS